MPKLKAGAEAEYHIVGVRMRVTGSGNLKLNLRDLSNVQNVALTDIPMATSTRFEPTVLADFQSQRTRLQITTTEINETFRINRIIIFAKPVAMEYPM